MKNDSNKPVDTDAMQDEYDFRGARKNPYAARYAKGTNVVVLSPDVAKAFPDSESVNRALRACLEVAQAVPKQPTKRAG